MVYCSKDTMAHCSFTAPRSALVTELTSALGELGINGDVRAGILNALNAQRGLEQGFSFDRHTDEGKVVVYISLFNALIAERLREMEERSSRGQNGACWRAAR